MAAMLGTRSAVSRSLLRHLAAKGKETRCLSRLAALTEPRNVEARQVQPQVWGLARGLHTTPLRRDEIKDVLCPPFADSISEGDVRWEKQVGDSVGEDDVLCEIETDKTSVPVPSPAAGVVAELLVEDGATVSPGTKLLRLKLGAGGAPPPPKPAAETPAPAAAAPPPPPPPPPPPAAAASAPIPATPPPPPAMPAAPRTVTPPPAPLPPRPAAGAAPVVKMPPADPTTQIAGTRSEHRVKMNRMRMKIASRLKEAQNTNAMLTTFNELDMSNIMQLRKDNQDAFVKKHGIKMGFMSAFVKASAYALTKQPTVNAVIEGQEIIYRDFVDISVAVATPKGLVVPVLRNVEAQSYADIEKGIAALGQKAKNNQIAVEDMDGGTFTISNGGVFGSLFGTPIINPPQSAILGMHGVFERPVVRNGQVVIRPMMYIALTYDHRLVDGREAVTFLRTIKNAVEDPRVMFMEL